MYLNQWTFLQCYQHHNEEYYCLALKYDFLRQPNVLLINNVKSFFYEEFGICYLLFDQIQSNKE